MVSFDVTSLYMNTATIDSLNIIKDYVNNDDPFTRKTAIPQDKFLDLVDLVLTTTWYTFNSQFYQQTDGVATRGPASSTTAEIYMQAYEHTLITTALHPPKVWERFVDVYSILKCTHFENFFHHQQSSSKQLRSDEHKRSVWDCNCNKTEIAKDCWCSVFMCFFRIYFCVACSNNAIQNKFTSLAGIRRKLLIGKAG